MRGTLVRHNLPAITMRITPAYAGNTEVMLVIEVSLEDHPRVCGEHLETGKL